MSDNLWGAPPAATAPAPPASAPAPRPSGGSLAPAAVAQRARADAALVRAEHMQSVLQGLLSVHDVISSACEPDGKPLLRISIRQLLLSQPGWGDAKVASTINRMSHLLDINAASLRTSNIAWLVDPRVQGTRLLAFTDAVRPQPHLASVPWTGFPFTPRPTPKV